ncbi:MAG TPA: NACHT domain-containing protein [Trebonia sp.]|nr:NACHT domain-containing protein [Trebonia sp.]
MDAKIAGEFVGGVMVAIGAVGWLARLLYHRFKKSGSREVEPFARYVGQGVKYYLGRYVRHQLAAEFTLRQYARLQLRTVAREMFVPASVPVRLSVDQAFIPLLLRDSLQEHLEYSQLLDRPGRRLIILGEPGSGKSSLFKRLFRDACRRAATAPRKAPLPILYELRNLAGSRKAGEELTGQRLLDLLLAPLRESAVYAAARGLEDLGYGAGFLILLDGLDEVSDSLSGTVVAAIGEMCQMLGRTSPKSTVLLSSRNQYYFARNDRELQEGFDVLSVRPFTLGDIYSFLARWPFTGRARENITRLFSRLRQLPSLTEMCTNPLALSMFVARDQQTGGTDLPETRSRFYESLMDELIVNRRARGENLPAGRQRLRDARRAVLGRVCLEHLLCRDEAPNSVPRARFIAAIKQEKYGGRDPDQALDDLASDTGLFVPERRGETERFLHLTLCEFLAAVEVVETGELGWDKAFSLLGDPEGAWDSRLAEVVAFACGLAGRSLRQRILGDLATIDAPQLMLKAVIEAQVYGDPVAERAIDSECRYLAGQDTGNWDAKWFSRLRVTVGVLRDAQAGRPRGTARAPSLPASADFLVSLMETHNAEELLLETLARQDAEAAISIASETRRRELMDHVASAADDFAVLQGIMSKCEAGDGEWRAALCEKALLDKNVARTLSSLEADTSEARLPGPWRRTGLLGSSAYASIIDDFLRERQHWSVRMPEFLALLASVKAPSRWLVRMPGPRQGMLIVAACVCLASPIILFLPFILVPAVAVSASSVLMLIRLRETRTRGRISKVSVTLGKSISIAIETDADSVPAREAYATKTRVHVLREIFNLTSSAREGSYQLVEGKLVPRSDEHPWAEAILHWIPPREQRCLTAARSSRLASGVVTPLDAMAARMFERPSRQ